MAWLHHQALLSEGLCESSVQMLTQKVLIGTQSSSRQCEQEKNPAVQTASTAVLYLQDALGGTCTQLNLAIDLGVQCNISCAAWQQASLLHAGGVARPGAASVQSSLLFPEHQLFLNNQSSSFLHLPDSDIQAGTCQLVCKLLNCKLYRCVTLGSVFIANGMPVMTTARPARSEKSSPSLTLPLQLPTQQIRGTQNTFMDSGNAAQVIRQLADACESSTSCWP